MKTPALLGLLAFLTTLALTLLALAFLPVSCKPHPDAARADFNARVRVKSNAWSMSVKSFREQYARRIRDLEAQLANPPPGCNPDEIKRMLEHLQRTSGSRAAEADAFREDMRKCAQEWEARNWKGYKIPVRPPGSMSSDCCGPDGWYPDPPTPPPQ